jgi:sulfur carrier protein ThiS
MRVHNRGMASAATEITVAVRFGGRFGGSLEARRRSIRLPAGATVEVLLATLAADADSEPSNLAAAAVAVGGEVVGRDHALRDGDAVALIVPVAGG